VLLMMRVMQIRWTRTWAEKGGRARTTGTPGSTAATFRQTAKSPR
jgi:NNP family nitrate/nitrite transporter-like MFS transporter